MAFQQLYLDSIEIENETQLTFQEHKVQELISKQISLEYGVSDLMTIMTLLIALGAMMISMIANHISSSSNQLSRIIAIVILLASGGYAGYAQCKIWGDESKLQNQITQTMNAIHTYKENNPPKDTK